MRSYANNDGFGVQFSMDATMEFKNGFDIIEDLINWPQDNQVSLALDVALLNNKIRACIAFEGTRFCTGKCEGDADCVSRPLRPLFFRLLLYRTKLTLTRFSYYRRLPKLVTTHLKYAVRNEAMGANVEGLLDVRAIFVSPDTAVSAQQPVARPLVQVESTVSAPTHPFSQSKHTCVVPRRITEMVVLVPMLVRAVIV